MDKESKHTSILTALRVPAYRRLWLACVLSGIGVGAYECAAVWAVFKLGQSTLLLSLMTTVGSLPFFLFSLPAGALVDLVDRRKLLFSMTLWCTFVALVLAICDWLKVLSPALVLTCVFLIGVGVAFSAPAWTALLPDLVSEEHVASAATLNGVQLNLAAVIGPVVGGALIPVIGRNWVFTINALCFVVVALAILQWRSAKTGSKLPLESFFESLIGVVRYIRYAPAFRMVLGRIVLFGILISLIPALLPVIGLKEVKLDAIGCGIMYGSLALGSVLAVYLVPIVRKYVSPNSVTVIAALLVLAVYLLLGVARDRNIFMVLVATLGGIAWTMAASELWLAAHRATPGWATGRMNAVVIAASQGALALGGVIWGSAATGFGTERTLIGGMILLLLSLFLALRFSIDVTENLSSEPAPVTSFSHRLIHTPQPHDGPIALSWEFQVDRSNGSEFVRLMREVRLIHLRNGAISWRLHEDLGRLNTYRVEMVVPSWNQHFLQWQRLTKTEREMIERIKALQVGGQPLDERIFLCVDKELARARSDHPLGL
jgi:MFS family permease